MGRGKRLLLCVVTVVLQGCAHRTVTVNTDPPGALVGLYPGATITTVSPGPMVGLRAGRSYTLRVTLGGYDTTYASIPPAEGFPWPPPINLIIQLAGGYDSTVDIKLRPCSDSGSCSEDEQLRRLPR